MIILGNLKLGDDKCHVHDHGKKKKKLVRVPFV